MKFKKKVISAFFKYQNVHFVNISLCVEMAKIFIKKTYKKIATKSVKMQILKNGLHYLSSWSNMYLHSKFQVTMMFDG